MKGGTFRENVFGETGQSFLHKDHPAYPLRWEAGVSKEDFEKGLEEYQALRLGRRE